MKTNHKVNMKQLSNCQVGITKAAKQALVKLAAESKKKVPLSQGAIASKLILSAKVEDLWSGR